MQGHIAHAALACTSGFWFLSSDHSNLTPSSLSMILLKTKSVKWNPNLMETPSAFDKPALFAQLYKIRLGLFHNTETLARLPKLH